MLFSEAVITKMAELLLWIINTKPIKSSDFFLILFQLTPALVHVIGTLDWHVKFNLSCSVTEMSLPVG